MTDPLAAGLKPIRDSLHDVVTFYNRFLDTPEGEDTPYRDTFISIRTEIQALAEGGEYTEYAGACLCVGLRHYYRGAIPVEELGLPEPSPEDTQNNLRFITEIADLIRPQEGPTDSFAALVVNNLGNQHYPRTPQQMTVLLSLMIKRFGIDPTLLHSRIPQTLFEA